MKSKKSKIKKVLDSIINFVIDESGSMGGCRSDTIGGFNEFLKEQKKLKQKANFSLTKFNTKVTKVYTNKDMKDVKDLTEVSYTPGGNTALYDAIGMTIKAVEDSLTEKTKKSKVLVVIMTDGQENSSQEYKSDSIKKLIEDKTAEGNWTFTFLGAGQDAILAGGRLGVLAANSVNYNTSNMKGTMGKLSSQTTSYRSAVGGQSCNFFDGKKDI